MEKFFSKFSKKNKKARSELYQLYGRKLYGYAITKWNVSEDDAWELIYKTIDKTIETFDKYIFENETKFASFIFKIFINYLRNHYRDSKGKRLETVSIDENFPSSVVNEDLSNKNDESDSPTMQILREELNKLEDWQRILLLMRAQDYSYKEIANYIDKPEDQLKVYHMRFKQKITEIINARIKNKE